MKKSKILILSTISIVSVVAISASIITMNQNSNMQIAKENISDAITIEDNNDKKIYGEFKTNASWVKDPSEIENLLDMANNDSIVKLKINAIGEANFLKPTDPTPYTPIEVTIEEVIEGNNVLGSKTIYVEGGNVKVSNVMKTLNDAEIEKMGMQNITEEQKNNEYISYTSDYDYNLELNKEYIVVLSNNSIMANGYGIFTEQQTDTRSSGKVIKNVLTEKTFNY